MEINFNTSLSIQFLLFFHIKVTYFLYFGRKLIWKVIYSIYNQVLIIYNCNLLLAFNAGNWTSVWQEKRGCACVVCGTTSVRRARLLVLNTRSHRSSRPHIFNKYPLNLGMCIIVTPWYKSFLQRLIDWIYICITVCIIIQIQGSVSLINIVQLPLMTAFTSVFGNVFLIPSILFSFWGLRFKFKSMTHIVKTGQSIRLDMLLTVLNKYNHSIKLQQIINSLDL